MVIGIGPLMQEMVYTYDGNKAWFPEVEAAREELPGLLTGAKVILMKGSRGMALERLLPALKN
jgi:UDP-N-acetylmuramyl pentapeptide synthase